MSSTAVAAHEYWGYLIKPDKSPTPIFEQLLYGIANYINHQIAPWDTNCLTPTKLAAFYRLVGGDYDPFFLDTSQASLSFIYQSLGCFHTLQPERDPYSTPTLPALTPQGFVRWQTVQLLLEPEEHVPFLQNAVKRFDLLNPADGAPFPSILPKEALPAQPDPDVSEWHSAVSQKLMLEAQASASRNMPPRPQMALSDIDLESFRDSSVDSHPVAGTDMAGYFAGPRASFRAPSYTNSRAPPLYPTQCTSEAPWSPERRHSSLPANGRGDSASWPRHGPPPTSFPPSPRDTYHTRRQHHRRADSKISTISTSTSDSSSIISSSASLSPVRYHAQLHQSNSPGGRRHSTVLPPRRPASHPQGYLSPERESSGTKNVRWQDMDDVFDGLRYSPRHDGRTRRDMRHEHGNGEAEERARGRPSRSTGPTVGVGGRRYAEGVNWR